MNENAQSKWTSPDVINGVLHVGKGYRQAWMHLADRLRTDREQWYPGDGEKGENGIWGDARPGSFDPSKVYRVPVRESDVGQGNRYVAFAAGYRKARPEDCWRTDRHEIVFTDELGSYKWIQATPGENHPSAIYQVPVERKDEPGVHGDSQGEAVRPVFEGQRRPIMTAEHAVGILGWHMRADSDFAWTWHCNIAMAAADAGAPIKEANERAADFIRNAFGVDVRDCEQWKAAQSQAVPPPVGEFEGGGREGGPDYHPGKCDAVEPEYLTAADFLPDDGVNHPSHYNAGPIECIDAIRAALTAEEFRGFCKGNTIKYVWRERGKGGDEDLHKGGWYLVRARNDGQGVTE